MYVLPDHRKQHDSSAQKAAFLNLPPQSPLSRNDECHSIALTVSVSKHAQIHISCQLITHSRGNGYVKKCLP